MADGGLRTTRDGGIGGVGGNEEAYFGGGGGWGAAE